MQAASAAALPKEVGHGGGCFAQVDLGKGLVENSWRRQAEARCRALLCNSMTLQHNAAPVRDVASRHPACTEHAPQWRSCRSCRTAGGKLRSLRGRWTRWAVRSFKAIHCCRCLHSRARAATTSPQLPTLHASHGLAADVAHQGRHATVCGARAEEVRGWPWGGGSGWETLGARAQLGPQQRLLEGCCGASIVPSQAQLTCAAGDGHVGLGVLLNQGGLQAAGCSGRASFWLAQQPRREGKMCSGGQPQPSGSQW